MVTVEAQETLPVYVTGKVRSPGMYRVRKDTDVIVVTGRSYNPRAAAALANSIAKTYFRRDLQENNQATRQARRYAEEKMVVTESDLANANAELSAFKRRTGLFAPETQLTKTAEHVAQMTLELDDARTEAAASHREIATLDQQLRLERPNVVTGTSVTRNPHYDAIVEKIQSLNSERIALLESFRILRNNIAFSSVERPLKTLAVTSACRAEGKSTVVSNLAIAIALGESSAV